MTDRMPKTIDLAPIKGGLADDRLQRQAFYEGILFRRCFAFFIDCVILFCFFILGHLATCATSVFTLGVMTPLAVLIVGSLPIVYGTLSIGGSSHATPGMRAMDLTVCSWQGGKPDYLQAFLMTVLFYATTVPFGGLLLLYALFDRRLRCLHDHLAGVVVVRRSILTAQD